MLDHGTTRRTALKILASTSFGALSTRFSQAQAALQPVQMGIQIFTGAVATASTTPACASATARSSTSYDARPAAADSTPGSKRSVPVGV